MDDFESMLLQNLASGKVSKPELKSLIEDKPKPDFVNPVVVAEKCCFKGALHGHITNGGGIVPLSHNTAIRFIAHNETYVTLQILEYGIGTEVKSQSWHKTAYKPKGKKEGTVTVATEEAEEVL